MNLTYLDIDTQEIIAVVVDPASAIYEVSAERFAAGLGATIERMVPQQANDWIVELRVPCEVREAHMPLPGDEVIFTAKVGYREQAIRGIYEFKRGHSYVICDQYGGEWQVQSMWQMTKKKKVTHTPVRETKMPRAM